MVYRTLCTIADGDGVDQELRDRKAVSQDHQHQHQHVPQAEAVERGGHALRRMNRERIERARDRPTSASTERNGQISDEQNRRYEQDDAASE